MNQRWRVQLHPNVIRYLYDLREQGMEIRQAIAELATGGPPADARETTRVGFYLWIEARHWITFRLEMENRAIYITSVEPLEESKQ